MSTEAVSICLSAISCLGVPLARLEAKIAPEVLLSSKGILTLKPDSILEPVGGIIVYGVRQLPLMFDGN